MPRFPSRLSNRVAALLKRLSRWTTTAVFRSLREAGHIDPASAFYALDFSQVPYGLNASELEKYLREHGAEASR
jgi:hypothetical protein